MRLAVRAAGGACLPHLAVRSKGRAGPPRGLLLIPTFAVLLFPGVQLVFGALAALFWLAEAVGAPIVIENSWLGLALSVVVWLTSAYVTYRAWFWGLPRALAAFESWSPREKEDAVPEVDR